MFDDPIVLYVVVRGDLDSLNPGKAAAQACHAANRCIWEAAVMHVDDPVHGWITSWQGMYGFGTTIVLVAPSDLFWHRLQDMASQVILDEKGHAGYVIDESYPVRDGNAMHYPSCGTCIYIFGPKSQIEQYTRGFSLMP